MTSKKFFPINQEVETQILAIKKSLKLAMNGVVSDNMRDRGVKYRINYGVSLPKIKELAARYPSNELLADRLWHLHIRETMIMATIIMPIDKLTTDKANEWISCINTQEMIEMSAMLLFSKWDKLNTIAPQWLQHPDYRFQATACLACARIVNTTPNDELSTWLNLIKPSILTSNYTLATSIGIFLEKLALKESQYLNQLIAIEQELRDKNESAPKALHTKIIQTIALICE